MAEKGNKGDWSEFYAFLKILSDRCLQSSDQNLNPIPGKVFSVQKILKNDENIFRTYDSSSEGKVFVAQQNCENDELNEFEVSYDLLKAGYEDLLILIKKGSGAFYIPEMDELLSKLNYGKIKAKSSSKGDIRVVIHDYVTNSNNTVEFSIKSYLGAKPTLLNAGKVATNFRYKVVGGTPNIKEINEISSGAKVKKRLQAIYDSGAHLVFDAPFSPQFQKNLRKIDSLMPIFLSEYIRLYYASSATTIKALTAEVCKSESIIKLLDEPFSYDDIKYKIKQLLINSALGMVPQSDWDGFYQADGGYIAVKSDGDIVCFHIYNIALLGEYLFDNTAFDTPSTSVKKFDHAYLYEQDGEVFFKLNFQIRYL